MRQSTSNNPLPVPPDGKKTGIIKAAFIFSALSSVEINELAAISSLRRYHSGEFIFLENDSPVSFFIIAAGQVKVVKQAASGKEFIIAFFGGGEIFGEVAIFENRPYPATAQAAVDTEILAIPRDSLLGFLSRQPQVAFKIIGVLGGRLREAQSRLKDLAVERVEQRLANALLMLSSRLGPVIPFTRQDIADMTGTTTETTIRTMTGFKNRGIITTGRGKITIISVEKLRLLSEGPPRLR